MEYQTTWKLMRMAMVSLTIWMKMMMEMASQIGKKLTAIMMAFQITLMMTKTEMECLTGNKRTRMETAFQTIWTMIAMGMAFLTTRILTMMVTVSLIRKRNFRNQILAMLRKISSVGLK